MKLILVATFFSIVATVSADFQRCLNFRNSKSDVITRDDNRYSLSNFQFNIRHMVYPLGYVVVRSTRDVQRAIRCARKHKVHLSVMCGKHSFEKYSYGNNGTWIIDLSKLTKIKINRNTGIATVSSGNRLHRISEYLWKYGKYGITVGTCFSVGISGFALGGGFGLTARKFGLLLDRTVGYQIVTANGNVRRVTQNTEKDLYWALRGAGEANFGVVTKFYFQLFDASNKFIWVIKQYNYSELSVVFTKWQQWITSNVSKSFTSNFRKDDLLFSTFNVTFVINNQNMLESETQLYSIRQQFPNINDADIFRGSYMEMLSMTSTPYFSVDTTPRFYFRSKGFYVSRILNETEVEKFVSTLHNHPFVEFLIEMYGGAINEPNRTDTAFVHRTSLYVIQLRFYLYVKNNTNVDETMKLGEEYENQLKQLYEQLLFMSNGEQYQNYVDNDLPDWFEHYYGENGDRLKQIKIKVDPTNFFRYNQSIPLK